MQPLKNRSDMALKGSSWDPTLAEFQVSVDLYF